MGFKLRKQKQQERMIREICRSLKTYDYKDVEKRMFDDARKRRKERRMYGHSVGNITIGGLIPLHKEIIHILNSAEWSHVVEPGDRHRLTRFEYREEPRDR